MGLIDKLLSRAINFNEKLANGIYIQNIIYENEAFIIDMNAEEQLFEQGINRLGISISDYAPYSPYTIQIKEQKGQPTNRVTLRDEGDFESSFFLQVSDKQFEIKAGDFKTEELIKKYGRQILGLTYENISQLIWSYIYPDLIDITKKELYGKD